MGVFTRVLIVIDIAVVQLATELNTYLNVRAPALAKDRVVLASLFDLTGAPNGKARDKVVLEVVNVEENQVYRSLETFQTRADGAHERVRPEVRVNIYLLFIANFDKYDEALKAISHVIAFFQHRGALEISENGAARRRRVVFELYSMTFEQQNHLWASLGAKYMPSVVYKAGIVEVRDAQVEAEVPPVEEIRSEA